MGGPNPEERGPESDDRDSATAAEDAPPSAAPGAPVAVDAGAGARGTVEEKKNQDDDGNDEKKPTTTTTASEDGPSEPQAQEGDAPPRFKGVTKWFNSQKGTEGAAAVPWETSARREKRERD